MWQKSGGKKNQRKWIGKKPHTHSYIRWTVMRFFMLLFLFQKFFLLFISRYFSLYIYTYIYSIVSIFFYRFPMPKPWNNISEAFQWHKSRILRMVFRLCCLCIPNVCVFFVHFSQQHWTTEENGETRRMLLYLSKLNPCNYIEFTDVYISHLQCNRLI